MTDTTGVAVYATTRLIEVTAERDALREALERAVAELDSIARTSRHAYAAHRAQTAADEARSALPAKSKEME